MLTNNTRALVTPRAIRVFILTLLWVSIGAYFGWHLYNLFRAPILIVENPAHDIITHDEALNFFGRVQKETNITINGTALESGSDGMFQSTILLQAGMNVIEVKAINKFKKETVVVRRVVRE